MSISNSLLIDIFNDDAFSMSTLTAAINELDHVPGRAGELVFAAIGEGIETLSVSIERQGESLSVIPTSPRGAPAPKSGADKRSLRNFHIPQIKLEDTIYAHTIQSRTEFTGSAAGHDFQSHLRGVEGAVADTMQKMTRRQDLTIEHHRLGALTGVIRDADGTVLVNTFAEFDVLNSFGFAGPETFDFDLDNHAPGFDREIRVKCQHVDRAMRRRAKMVIPPTALIWAFCGDSFFDKLISHPCVKDTYAGQESAAERLGGSYAFDVFEFGNIMFENYRGTDDLETVAIEDDECRFFWTGVPDLYIEKYAPADFMESVNKPGLPRYAKAAPDLKFGQFIELHTQQNPLPLCVRPQTLMRGVVTTEEESSI